MKTRNLSIENFSTDSGEILNNDQLVALVGGDGANDGTIAPDPMIWLKG